MLFFSPLYDHPSAHVRQDLASEWHNAVAGGQSISAGWLLLGAGVNALLTANAFGDDCECQGSGPNGAPYHHNREIG